MKLDKAREIATKWDELGQAQKQLTRFNDTKEFCKIKITGEDGTEREHSFYIDHKKDQDAVRKIRKCIEEILEDRIEKLCGDIDLM